jgi:hypothetical protein
MTIKIHIDLKRLTALTEPKRQFIGDAAKELYRLEEKRSEAIQACAHEWAKLMDVSSDDLWSKSMPQALFDTLETFDTSCAIIAAEAFLKQFGWNIERPDHKHTVYAVTAEHPSVPGIITKVCATREKAVAEAIAFVNIILVGCGMKPVMTADMNVAIDYLQNVNGAAHCYADVVEHEVI